MNPWGRFGLAHPEHASMEPLCGILLEIDPDTQQPILGGRPGTVLIGGRASGLPASSMQGPCGHIAEECALKGRHECGKFVHCQARHISHLGRMRGKIAIPSHQLSLLSWRVQYNSNRDELYYI
jgi:hypothetical protein